MSLFAARRSLLLLSGALLITALSAGCLFGGGDDGGSSDRPGSAPTATPPNPLPEPIDLGNPSTVGGGEGTPTGTGEQTYVTVSGDTLLAIAVNLGVSPEEQPAWIAAFLELNGLPSAAALQAGVEYRIPPFTASGISQTPSAGTPTSTPGSTQPTATPTPDDDDSTPTATPPSVAGGGGTYTVVSGDYPLLIAEKLGVPAAEQQAWADALVALNGIDPSNLSVGQVLELPEGTPGQAPLTTPTSVP